ncbi:protein NDR1-like [Pyrus ussuriensis x Pyrus communis]|uniref:Protein NDR1-like n=1 Tax=Pyrus ussuriensis x Pyrus communis TaxID=2448454 RepID=A0A5N5IRV0_9ROSA|nr:protein NDR1-like [Pyrus ussuriensis x Pyrus communis]
MCEAKTFNCWAMQFLAFLGLLALCLWVALRPKDPEYTIVDITIPESDLGGGGHNGSLTYGLQIKNPNKDSSIYYDEAVLTFLYGSDSVGEKHIPAFRQGKGKTRQLIDFVDVNPRVWKTFRNSILNATAELKVALLTRVQYKTWGVRSKHHGLDLHGKLPIGSDGKISGKKKKVKLSHASKKWRRSNSRRLLG